MDGGLFSNGQRSTDRRAAAPNRTEAAGTHRSVEESHPPVEHHRQTSPSRGHETPKSKKPVVLAVIIALVVLALAAILLFLTPKLAGGATGIDGGKYQAVFFTNGQVYFGKLQNVNSNYLKLTSIFYLQTKEASSDNSSDNPQKTTSNQSNDVQLVKLGSEIHGPEDEMIISRDQVLFYENLKSDGKVAQSIDQYKNQK